MHGEVLANVGPEEVESLVDVFGFEVDSWDLLQSPRRHYCLGRLCNGLVQWWCGWCAQAALLLLAAVVIRLRSQ